MWTEYGIFNEGLLEQVSITNVLFVCLPKKANAHNVPEKLVCATYGQWKEIKDIREVFPDIWVAISVARVASW